VQRLLIVHFLGFATYSFVPAGDEGETKTGRGIVGY